MKIMIFLGCRVSASYTFTSHFSYFYEYESGFVFGLRIQIYEVADYGSNLDPDPQHWLTAKNSTDTKYLYPDPFAEYGAQSSRPSKKRIRIRNKHCLAAFQCSDSLWSMWMWLWFYLLLGSHALYVFVIEFLEFLPPERPVVESSPPPRKSSLVWTRGISSGWAVPTLPAPGSPRRPLSMSCEHPQHFR